MSRFTDIIFTPPRTGPPCLVPDPVSTFERHDCWCPNRTDPFRFVILMRNGLYWGSTKFLDGEDAHNRHAMVLRDGTIRGGSPFFYTVGLTIIVFVITGAIAVGGFGTFERWRKLSLSPSIRKARRCPRVGLRRWLSGRRIFVLEF